MLDGLPRVVVIGDLLAEVITTLSSESFCGISSDLLVYSDVSIAPGGSAMGFALAAVGLFDSVTAVGVIGDDALGAYLLGVLSEHGVRFAGERAGGGRTGASVYVRDAAPSAPGGVRLLIVDRGVNDSLELDSATIDTLLSGSDALLTDGYCLFEEPRASTTLAAMKRARERGVRVAFDLVPHLAYLHRSLAWLDTAVASADTVIAEVRTLGRFLGLECPELITDDSLAALVAETAEARLGEKTYSLRYGAGNIGRSLIVAPGCDPVYTDTGYCRDGNPRGFGDRLTAMELDRALGGQRRSPARQGTLPGQD
jgi:sugar/nucleoside kinase (ribokinase family)